MTIQTRITDMLGIEKPIIQAANSPQRSRMRAEWVLLRRVQVNWTSYAKKS